MFLYKIELNLNLHKQIVIEAWNNQITLKMQ
jgi:hypothetical protein